MLLRRTVELLALFGGLPLLFDLLVRHGFRRLLFPGLWALACAAGWLLLSDPAFSRERLFDLPPVNGTLFWIAARTVAGVALLAMFARRVSPREFLALPRRMPALFCLIAVFYPLLSVVPQGLVWRVFFLHRYDPLLGHRFGLWAAAVLAFAWAHIVFRNAAALGLTAIGGALFLHSYVATGSMLLADVEHAIYGLAVFAFGLGKFLYLGWARRSEEPIDAPRQSVVP